MTVSTLTPSFDAPRFVTREPVAGSLVHRLSLGSATAALTFAGQGWPWWEDLTAILERRSWLRPKAQRWAEMIDDIAASPAVRDLGASSRRFDPLRWADSGDVPSAAELAALPLSMPGVLLTQLLAYREAWEDGLWSAVENGSIVAATGHSGGILAAGAVASDPRGLDDENALLPFLQVAVHLGHIVGASRESVGLSELSSALSGDQDAGTPMVAVAGMRTDRIADLLTQTDGTPARGDLARADRVSARIALHHGPYRAVLSGSPASLKEARRLLADDIAKSRSGTRLVWEPLAVSAPCHHPRLGAVTASLIDALRSTGVACVIPAEGLEVLNPAGPAPFARGVDVTEALVASMLTNTSHWYQSVSGLADGSLGTRPADWILDLGPSDGIAKLTEAGVRGSGARVLALTDESARRKLVTAGATPQLPERRFESYAPTVVRVPGGQIRLDNAFTRATGRSPMVLPGMTPTTVDAPIVAAAANHGFLAELAGGGQVTREIFAERLIELGELLDPGQEIVFNALHLDPYLWNLHLGGTRLVQEARRAGAPICGVTVSAGIPEVDDAVALLDELTGLDMWCNAFKPGTAAQIRQVLAIADAAPRHTVFMHVEGGTAGGHHSWVDLEDLLLGSYHQIRTRPNVVLCVGGGIGTPERATELLTGKWALDHVGRVMPVDAVLLGTVAMATAEATATYGAKLALKSATGTSATGSSSRRSDGGLGGGAGFVAPGEFHGGVTSGRSGLDADIHFLDNSASRCAALLDEVAGNSEAVASRRDEIIAGLARTAKPYFGDVSAVTYETMLRRFVELTAIGRQGRYEDGAWLDTSHRQRFIALLQRAEARLDPAETGEVATLFDAPESVDDPIGAIGALLDAHPSASDTPLHPADAGFFLAVCRQPGKPVPFVPVIDADVRRWYQSDSLWQAQHPHFDADATLIIPGPAAVSGITAVDEPVADLLTRFEAHVVETLCVETLCKEAVDITRLQRRDRTAELRGPVAALLEARTVVVGTTIRPNPVLAFGDVQNWQLATDQNQNLTRATMRLEGPGRTSEVVTLEVSPEDPDEVAVLTIVLPALQSYGESKADNSVSGRSPDHALRVGGSISELEGLTPGSNRLTLEFRHRNSSGVDIVELDVARRTASLRRMLNEVLIGASKPSDSRMSSSEAAVPLGKEVVFTATDDPLRRAAHSRLLGASGGSTLPDGWLPVVWSAVFAALGADEIVGSLLDLVHLEHAVTITAPAGLLRRMSQESGRGGSDRAGSDGSGPEKLTVRASITSISAHDAGTRIDTVAEVVMDDISIVRVDGAFLLRDTSIAEAVGGGSEPSTPVINERPRKTIGRVQVTTPPSMDAFAAVSGDHNPIHRSVAVARLAGLDAPIVHGAWTSAAAQQAVVEHAAGGRADRVTSWRARFMAPVELSERLTVSVVRTGVRDAHTVVEATVVANREDGPVPVLLASAEIAPPRTAYLFPGQGIQRPGMGMDGYDRSPAAREIWDRADKHTRERLGFSILTIVRDNPTIISAAGADGSIEVHRHPLGVLHLTQFTQVAMAALASAQVAELREEGLFDEDSICAGHSVGEYNALAAVGGVLQLEAVVELVFRRGQAMHHLVPRDEAGRSDYRLGVVRPHQIGMDHAQVEELVGELRDELGQTLEIVNYNLRGKQYAVAGTNASLAALESALESRATKESRPAFLYVPGIDVPFHSSVLRNGVEEFRSHLAMGLPSRIDPDLLVDRYVPNLVPRLFSLDRAYVEEVCALVDSESLAEVLRDWDDWKVEPERLCRELLIELLAWQFASPVRWIETQDLLFTRVGDGGVGIERVVEVGLGSAPTVTNLAKGTLALDVIHSDVLVHNIEADRAIVFAIDENPELDDLDVVGPDAGSDHERAEAGGSQAGEGAGRGAQPEGAAASGSELQTSASSAPAAATATSVPAAVQPSEGTAVAMDDLPVSAGDALVLLIALQLKVRPDQLLGSESIDDLVDGVSSRRNQLLMDLGAEFNISGVDGARELPLTQLAVELSGRASRYKFPGPVLRDARDSALARVLGPLRIKPRDVSARVSEHWNLGDGWSQRVLTALAFDGRESDSARGGTLGRLVPLGPKGNDAVDAAVQLVAADAGVPLIGPGESHGTVDAAEVRSLEERIAGPGGLIADVARGILDRVAPDASESEPVDSSVEDRLSVLDDEHGERRASEIAGIFDPRRHVAFTSWWATARHDVLALHHAGLRGAASEEDLDAEACRLARYVTDPGVRAHALFYAERAELRGDHAAVRRFRTILDSPDWSIQVPSTRPGVEWIDGVAKAVELPAGEDRIATLLTSLGLDGITIGRSGLGARESNFEGEVAVVTGASPGSIAVEVVRHLLAGGATVVCTTTNASSERLDFYRELYRMAAAPGAELHVVPANLASFGDIDALVDWVVSPVIDNTAGMARTLKDPMSPTLVLPFAAGPVGGDLADAGPTSEVAMRVLLWGVERLVGALAERSTSSGAAGRRFKVVLPLSPNHGGFGGDGAYGEAKAALEVFTEKWASEQVRWGQRVDLIAATIGWVRGTGLMDANDALAALVERDLGVRTFSSAEMGWLISELCRNTVRAAMCKSGRIEAGGPVRVDLSGGLGGIGCLRDAVAPLVAELTAANGNEDGGSRAAATSVSTIPALLSPLTPSNLSTAPEMLDKSRPNGGVPTRKLEDMVVIVGAGEVGPWGGSATRFDLEVDGELAPGSVAELAWMCGLIWWDQELDGGTWVDVESNEPVAEGEIADRYRDAVASRCGIRTYGADGPLDPAGISLMAEVFIDSDIVIPVADEAEGRAFAAADPGNTKLRRNADGDWQVLRKAGSSIRVPRRAKLTRRVGAQIPVGFDPTRWGIPAEMAASVDRLSLWNLVATVEAFVDAGMDPEELMARVHPARVANTQGSGMGGMTSIQTLYRDAVLGGEHSNDLLQEGLGNVMAAYVVQSYVGSYGPMIHPVAACATAAVSVEEAVDKIRADKADFVVAGGWDDLALEGVLGFGEMSATASTDDMTAAGLEPSKFSRPNDRRRGGFVEAQGGGTVLLARASVAAEVGLPVRGVVAYAASFADGIHTSIPAPGLGALACVSGGQNSPLAKALADHGLVADDIAVVSKHDTSTAANDPNESDLHQRIAETLGRSEGNPLAVISQKSVTGHAKGGSAAWQTIGLLQVLETGQIPGNRNLECLDETHREHIHLSYGYRSITAGEPLRAGLVTSLGFGHVSAVLCIADASTFHRAIVAEGAGAEPAATNESGTLERYLDEVGERRFRGMQRRLASHYGGEPLYSKRVDRRFKGAENSEERHHEEATMLIDASSRLGADGNYVAASALAGAAASSVAAVGAVTDGARNGGNS